MKFIKDILLVQLETTGNRPERDYIVQIGAVLLDKDNLLEKSYFNSYIKSSYLDGTLQQHAQTLNIPFELLNTSPKLSEVIKKFHGQFSQNVTLAFHRSTDVQFLKQAYKKSLLPFDFDDHMINVWTLGYIYSMHYGLKKIPTLNTLLAHFNLKPKELNNALEKARLTSIVFKKIITGTS